MKFEKRLHQHTQNGLPDWSDKYLSYKQLKQHLKRLSKHCPQPLSSPQRSDVVASEPAESVEPLCLSLDQADFLQLLRLELDKLNAFFLEKEEEFVIRLQEVQSKLEEVGGVLGSEFCPSSNNGRNDGLIEICKEMVNIHGEIVLLKHYSSLNYTGIVKILKKHDRHTGGHLQWPFIRHALHEPFFTTDILTQLLRDCEETLQFLFGSGKCDEGEGVIQGGFSLEGENVGSICRGTMAALRTLSELGKGSSTYNAFSIPPSKQGPSSEKACISP